MSFSAVIWRIKWHDTEKSDRFFAPEGNYPDLTARARPPACPPPSGARPYKLHAHIKASYPNIMRVGTFERIGHHAVLITIPGSDASLRPCLYMSHQDVVPVVEGTEQDWTHPAFSGDIADGYIWGRGTLDIKEQVFGVLEAAEYLLARGKSFARTAYLAFGDDEETINLGALAIAEHLKARGVTLEFVLDEGGCKIEPGIGLRRAGDVHCQRAADGKGLCRFGALRPQHRRAFRAAPTAARHLGVSPVRSPTSRAHRLPCASTAP